MDGNLKKRLGRNRQRVRETLKRGGSFWQESLSGVGWRGSKECHIRNPPSFWPTRIRKTTKPGTLNNQFLMDVCLNNNFPCKDFASSN